MPSKRPPPPPMVFKTATAEAIVKMKPAGNELLVREPIIRMRTADGTPVIQVRTVAASHFQRQGKTLNVEIKLTDPETKEEVPISEAMQILEHYGNKNLSVDNGAEVNEENIKYYEIQPDSSEKEASPFEATRVFDVSDEEHWLPSTATEGYVITEVYEIYPEYKAGALPLFEEAEKRWKADQVYIMSFSHGSGFKAYYAFLCPFFTEGKWVWLLKKTDKKLAYNFLQDPPITPKAPIREAPTVQTLPPIQVLVMAAKKKK